MRIVQLSEQDRGIIRACSDYMPLGKNALSDMRSMIKAQDAIKIDDVPKGDPREYDAGVNEYQMEEAEWEALKKIVNGEGKQNLAGAMMKLYVACVDHIEVAKEAPKE